MCALMVCMLQHLTKYTVEDETIQRYVSWTETKPFCSYYFTEATDFWLVWKISQGQSSLLQGMLVILCVGLYNSDQV